ncbi:MAG TPA: GNAT family N-acetyltransferase [Anaerolineales bacterium]
MNQTQFSIRPAVAGDMDAIRWLVKTGRINPTGLDWRRFVVAISHQGEVIGCGQIKPHRDGSQELASIVVHPDWRERGVARSLITHLCAAHPGDLYLMCRAELGPMYEKFGFRRLVPEEMPRYFQRISRLAGLLEVLRSEGVRLLVMKRDGGGGP